MEDQLPSSASTGVYSEEAEIICVPDLVQRQVALRPDAVAVSADREVLSYRDLDRRSNQLAHYLHSFGVKSGDIVGLSVERGIDFVVAALAILKAGAAYLPFETKTPTRRAQVMLDSAQVSLLVTHSCVVELSAVRVKDKLALDLCAGKIGACSEQPLATPVTPNDLAYVIYTSGSTGTPKAVAVGHDNLLNLIQWHNQTFALTQADRTTQLASIGFDAAVWELWPSLVAGASVHVVDDTTRSQPEQLRDWLVRQNISISFVPTLLAEQLLKLDWPQDGALRFLLTGADTLHHYPPANLPFILVNNYGPTECTVVATSAVLPRGLEGRLPPIGRPIDNVTLYILDENMKQVPTGVVGELYIGGAGVARGYLNDPALTSDRFVRNPFSSAPGSKLYRTGDLGCSLADGQIAFHGRVDDQVKIRGYRIELNEIVCALNQHPSVRESVIIAHEKGHGEKQLIAYFVPVADRPPLNELRDFLSRQLPDYMLPAAFVSLEGLPIGANGKVDRLALPAPDPQATVRDEMSAPSTPTQQRVATIVASLLGLKQVEVNENFFYLGGNSLFGTQVIARLREAFSVELPLLKLFDHPTVAELAGEVERMMIANLQAMSEDDAQRLLALNTEQSQL